MTHTLRSALIFSAVSVFSASVAHAAGSTLENPLNPAYSTVSSFIAGFLRAIVVIAMPIITLFIVIAGFKFVTAQGNTNKINDAKKNFQWVVIGALLLLGAWTLATLIGGTVTQLVGGN